MKFRKIKIIKKSKANAKEKKASRRDKACRLHPGRNRPIVQMQRGGKYPDKPKRVATQTCKLIIFFNS